MGEDATWRINQFVQSLSLLGLDLAEATSLEQGCDPGSAFAFLDLENHRSYVTNYYRQKLESTHMSDIEDSQFRNRIKHFVASKADLIFQLKGKEKLRSGIDYNVDGAQEAYSVFASQLLPLETGMQVSNIARRAQIFELLKVGDIILGKVVGKRPFGVFVRILSLVHGRNLDFNNIDIQALCHKSELETDHKSREHLDPIDDFDVDDPVQGVICSISKDEEKIGISFRSSKLPSEYGNIELGIIEDIDEQTLRPKTFDDDLEYDDYLRRDPGFSNPTNVHTLINVLGIDSTPPNSLLRSSQRWTFSDKEADDLRRQQSKKWSMDTTAIGVESFKSGNHEKALKYFNHALQIYDENSEALVARGALYANQNKLEYAIKDFKQALKLYPKHHNASKYLKETLFEKALRLKNISNIREAMNTFEEILKLDPDDIESQEHLTDLKSSLSAKLVEEKEKSLQAASLLQESRKKFEHVRKLIKSDPDVAKSTRKKRRKKKKKLKKVKMKKRRRRSEVSSEKTNTASEGAVSASDSQWVEKHSKKRLNFSERDERVVPGLREGQAMHISSVEFSTVELNSQSNLFEKENTLVKDESFLEGKATSSIELLLTNLKDTNRAGNLGGGLEEAAGDSGGEVETRNREKGERDDFGIRERIRSENNENVVNMSAGNRLSRRHNAGSRSRSGSHDNSKGLGRRSKARALSTRKKSERNTKESDVSSDDSQESHERRSRLVRMLRSSTRSSTDNESRHGRTREKRYGEIKSPSKNKQRNIPRNRSSASSGRSRSRGTSSQRDRPRIIGGRRSATRDSRERRRTSRGHRGRRRASTDSTGRRSASWDSRRQRTASRDSRGRRSASRDSRKRRSVSRDSRGRLSASRHSKRRRSASRDSRGRRSASRHSKRRWSASRESRGRRSESRDSRRSKSRDTREQQGTRRGSRRRRSTSEDIRKRRI